MHGEERGSVDRKHNVYGTPQLPANRYRKRAETRRLRHPPVLLNMQRRRTVELAIGEVCRSRRYNLLAVNARSNHVHAVISAACRPEPILDALKAYATRKLRREGLISATTKPWVRHGSTRYLWKEDQLGKAVTYVMYDQGQD